MVKRKLNGKSTDNPGSSNLKGTKNRDLAEKWIDFMLGVPYQADLPLNQFVYPVSPQAKLPEASVKRSSELAEAH